MRVGIGKHHQFIQLPSGWIVGFRGVNLGNFTFARLAGAYSGNWSVFYGLYWK
ncbi:MAG: hypothetical protein ABSG65_36675 [Bryobacteraceae bacterium]